jgi:uncharacterized protein YcbK (DUF882 family)
VTEQQSSRADRRVDARTHVVALARANRARRVLPSAVVARALLGVTLGCVGAAVAGTSGAVPAFAGPFAARRTPAAHPAPAAVAAADRVGARSVTLAAERLVDDVVLDDTLAGRSGKLRARFLRPSGSLTFPFLRRLLGDTAAAVDNPGVYEVRTANASGPFAFITMRAFDEKVGGRIGRYRIGFWPGERGHGRGGKYATPDGFIEVTPNNQHTHVSEHFRLADFLTHDQQAVWPKYLVLDEALVDKLELVIQELRRQGHDVKRMHVMSGFRTPQYNRSGGETGGRAGLSRHQYGDAADVWVENGHGRMADLNGDGRVDTRDAAIVAAAAERVERAHPELVGGVGIYRSTRSHGPFVHIDTRGYRARWGKG